MRAFSLAGRAWRRPFSRRWSGSSLRGADQPLDRLAQGVALKGGQARVAFDVLGRAKGVLGRDAAVGVLPDDQRKLPNGFA